MERPYRYTSGERYPVEVLVFKIDPKDLDEFLAIDNEVWTLGEALSPAVDKIPFLSKEIWVNDNRPGIVTVVLVWENLELWERIDTKEIQSKLIARFDAQFSKPYKLLRVLQNEENYGMHRVSRFERA